MSASQHAARLQREIPGESLWLRAVAPGDGAAIYNAVIESRAELARWLPWCGPDYARADSEAYVASRAAAWEQGEECSFAILDSQGVLLGCCGINQIDPPRRRANLGYWVRSSRTGQGVASQAARLLAAAALEQMPLERVEIVAAIDNRASQRAAEKAGATREGVARMRLTVCRQQIDAVQFSLVRADFGLAPLELADR